ESNLDNIATAPMSMITYMQEKVAESKSEEEKLAKIANQLYQQKLQQLGFDPKTDDGVEDKKMRNSIVDFLTDTGKNKELRSKLTTMAKIYTGYETDGKIHHELIDPNLINIALKVAAEDSDQNFTNHLIKLLDASTDGTTRGRLLRALSVNKSSEFAEELRNWMLSDRLRGNEIYTILFSQIYNKDKQDGMWRWLKDNFDPFKKKIPASFQGRLPVIGSDFCTLEKKKELNDFFVPIVEGLSGGPRSLAQVTESIDLCIAKRKHYRPMLKAYFSTLD
ncbi:MAG: ERAP1-like C-terminal domain-containing protein, partial [Alcanivoracaceae bacterium]|nr:ERAP1-like C-terminal domain-containing protein [Alcanivoracaceae bacterium]